MPLCAMLLKVDSGYTFILCTFARRKSLKIRKQAHTQYCITRNNFRLWTHGAVLTLRASLRLVLDGVSTVKLMPTYPTVDNNTPPLNTHLRDDLNVLVNNLCVCVS